MTHQRYLLIIGIAAFMSWIGWLVVVLKLTPFESTGMALGFFFLTLFLALACSFAIFGFYVRLWLNRNEVYYHHINISLRQGVLLSFLTLGALALQLAGVLTWWTGILLITSIVLIELYFALSFR
jgi:hypothetical protein